MQRLIEPELLDSLPPDDPRAIRSRKDLRRVNMWMGNPGIIAEQLTANLNGSLPRRILDIGAGDGSLMLRAVSRIAERWKARAGELSGAGRISLLDLQPVVSNDTLSSFKTAGWDCSILRADILEWLKQPASEQFDVIIANLFLHHFSDVQLRELLRALAERVSLFIAVEPRRWRWAFIFSHLVGFIGCSSVTRHDAVVSVCAGFAGQELSKLWPAGGEWSLEERPANWCSHLFIAKRTC